PFPTRRERLAHHVIAMRGERVDDLRIPFDLEHDAIRHLEPCLLAGLLNGAHELAREAFALELIVQRRIETDEVTALLRARETFGGRRLDQERLGRELDAVSADLGVLCLSARGGGRD